jgi:hypothetical protein
MNNPQSTAEITLYTIKHRAFPNGLRFQRFQQNDYNHNDVVYPYRDWTAPIALGQTAEFTNQAYSMIIRRTDLRQEPRLPMLDLCRGYDGLTSAIILALTIDTKVGRVDNQVYQIRSTLLQGGNIVCQLQCAGYTYDWPTIGGVTPTYQLI